MLERQQLLGNLEHRMNAQQKRIAEHEKHFTVLKRENAALRKLVTAVRAAYFQSIALKPTEKK